MIAFDSQSFGPTSFSDASFALRITVPPVSGGGGGGSHGAPGYLTPGAIEHEDDLRAAIMREDEEILAVLMGAAVTGALQWVH